MSDSDRTAAPRGRGVGHNPPNRYERLHVEPDDPGELQRDTVFLRDASRSIVATNDSPDVPFDASINPYRGCEHGCAYCYARPTHEYLGMSAGLDFESRILVKERAPELLRGELASRRWQPRPLGISGVTDPYQPVERRLGLTRDCLQVLAEFRNPVAVVTKNELVTRDIDVLADLAGHDAAAVFVSITTLDDELAGSLEPRTSRPRRRLAALAALAEAGIPCGVLVAPVIPGLTDHEIPAILEAAAGVGASRAGTVMLRLPGPVAPLFDGWLREHRPERRDRVLARIRDVRGGELNDPRFGNRMRGSGVLAEQLDALFRTTCRRLGLERGRSGLSTASFRRPGEQTTLQFG